MGRRRDGSQRHLLEVSRPGFGKPFLALAILIFLLWGVEGSIVMAERRIETNIEIDAPTERIWALLTDFARMPSWNPFIRSISGNLAQGDRLSVFIAPPGKSGVRFEPTVLTVRPEREIRWLGHLFISGIFDGEHYFLLEPIGAGKTRLTQGEKFSGLLVGLLGGTLSATEAGFKAMNTALKREAERDGSPDDQTRLR